AGDVDVVRQPDFAHAAAGMEFLENVTARPAAGADDKLGVLQTADAGMLELRLSFLQVSRLGFGEARIVGTGFLAARHSGDRRAAYRSPCFFRVQRLASGRIRWRGKCF